MKCATRNKRIAEQYLAGESIVTIGKRYGISRQRVYQIAHAAGAHRRKLKPQPRSSAATPFSQRRLELGLTLVEVAQKCGVTYVTAWEWEQQNRRRPGAENLAALARVYGWETIREYLEGVA